ncbi:hypothetical protein K466DRAFT_664372, partial [Polyporus arcularius HHB13444]
MIISVLVPSRPLILPLACIYCSISQVPCAHILASVSYHHIVSRIIRSTRTLYNVCTLIVCTLIVIVSAMSLVPTPLSDAFVEMNLSP